MYHEGRVGTWRNMEPYLLYLNIQIHTICIAESTWFLIHIREDQSVIDSDVYVYFPSDDMFTTNTEFAVNQRHMIVHLLYGGNRVLIIGHMFYIYLFFTDGFSEPYTRKYTTSVVPSGKAHEIIQIAGRPAVLHSACKPNYNGGDVMYLSYPAIVLAVVHITARPARQL